MINDCCKDSGEYKDGSSQPSPATHTQVHTLQNQRCCRARRQLPTCNRHTQTNTLRSGARQASQLQGHVHAAEPQLLVSRTNTYHVQLTYKHTQKRSLAGITIATTHRCRTKLLASETTTSTTTCNSHTNTHTNGAWQASHNWKDMCNLQNEN